MSKTIRYLFLFVICVICLVGCTAKVDSKRSANGDYKIEKTNLDITAQCDPLDYLMFLYKRGIVFVGSNNENNDFGISYDIYYEDLEKKEVKKLFGLQDRYLLGLTVYGEAGNQQIISLSQKEQEIVLEVYDMNGTQEKEVLVSDTSFFEHALIDFVKLPEENYVCLTNEEMFRIRENGEISRIELQYKISNIWATDDGKIYVIFMDEKGQNCLGQLCENNEIETGVKIPGAVLKSCDGKLYSINDEGVYWIDPENQVVQKTIDFKELGIIKSKVRTIYSDNEETCFVSYTTGDKEAQLVYVVPKTQEEKDATREQIEKYTESGKRIITIYCPYGDMSEYLLEDPGVIEEFNKQSSRYYVVLEKGSFDDIQTRFLAQNAPDLLLEYSSGAPSDYIKNGFLENMVPYLKENGNYNNISAEVKNLYEKNGEIFALPQYISWYSFFVPESLLEGKRGWTTEEFIEWIKKYPEMSMDTLDILDFCLLGNMEAYVNTEKMEAYFDQNEFKDLLEEIHELPNTWQPLEIGNTMEKPNIEKGYFLLGPFSSVGIFAKEEYVLGEKYVAIGYPNDKRKYTNPYSGSATMSLLSASNCKEGAMEFVDFYLRYPSYEFLENENENMWNIGKVFSLKELEEESKNLLKEGFSYEIGTGGETDTYFIPITDEQIARYYEGIGNMTSEEGIMKEIRNIVLEEAIEYFEGHKSAEEICKVIQNKVFIYINEQGIK